MHELKRSVFFTSKTWHGYMINDLIFYSLLHIVQWCVYFCWMEHCKAEVTY